MTRFRLVEKDIYYVGASDYKCGKFENHIPIPGGMAYNSYLLVDKKTVLFDTSDASVSDKFLENVEGLLVSLDRKLDYVVVTHMEPDHSSSLKRILEKYVDAKVVYNKKTQTMFKQFFGFTFEEREILVSEGDKLDTGEHVLEFFMAPMVHWPEVMMCYDHGTKSLFSADAFGAFGSLSGNLFDTEIEFDEKIIEDRGHVMWSLRHACAVGFRGCSRGKIRQGGSAGTQRNGGWRQPERSGTARRRCRGGV